MHVDVNMTIYTNNWQLIFTYFADALIVPQGFHEKISMNWVHLSLRKYLAKSRLLGHPIHMLQKGTFTASAIQLKRQAL